MALNRILLQNGCVITVDIMCPSIVMKRNNCYCASLRMSRHEHIPPLFSKEISATV